MADASRTSINLNVSRPLGGAMLTGGSADAMALESKIARTAQDIQATKELKSRLSTKKICDAWSKGKLQDKLSEMYDFARQGGLKGEDADALKYVLEDNKIQRRMLKQLKGTCHDFIPLVKEKVEEDIMDLKKKKDCLKSQRCYDDCEDEPESSSSDSDSDCEEGHKRRKYKRRSHRRRSYRKSKSRSHRRVGRPRKSYGSMTVAQLRRALKKRGVTVSVRGGRSPSKRRLMAAMRRA